MSADSEKVRDSLADQLANFDDKLNATVDDVALLAELQDGIGQLLAASGDSEGEIRQTLQEQYESGVLRKETFQLVKSMLDAFVSETIPTEPVPGGRANTSTAPSEVESATANNDFAATQRISKEPVVPLEATSIPLTTDFDPLTPNDERSQIPAPDIRRDANLVADDIAEDDQFGSTTVIPVDTLQETMTELEVQVGSVLRDRFLLQERVAGGSMGVVYKALDRRLAEAGAEDQWVAVKVLSPKLAQSADALRALQQEAAKGRCLIHPNIVRFIDLDRDENLYFIVMEWLEGRTLADILDSEEQDAIDRETAFRIVRQIGDALEYAHSCGIVHADVKPGNVMILPDGTARLFDFGVARAQQGQLQEGFDPGVLGALTPAYSSMQVLTGDKPVASDDVFSLACLLYRLVAGYRVFGPRDAAEASNEGMTPQRVNGFSEGQWATVKKALSYSRVTRFETVAEFMHALQDQAPDAIHVEVPERFIDEPESGGGRGVLLFLLLLVLAGVAGWQGGYLDPLIERIQTEAAAISRPRENDTPGLPDPALPASIQSESPVANDVGVDSPVADDAAELEPAETELTDPDTVGPVSNLVDFSLLPEPSIIVPISLTAATASPISIAVREDGEAAIIDFVRAGDLTTELSVRLEEVGFSGNRSPWGSGQYALSNSGLVLFPVGQERGRMTLTMASDPVREADQQSTLRVRETDDPDSELVVIQVNLEDDDQRSFEANLPPDTIAFASGQAAIRESDPAVQLDIVRFNPTDSAIVVEFQVQDITATDGEDYFAPGSNLISFGPRQRSARLLIPLVKDSTAEGDEAFVVELIGGQEATAVDVFQRIVVMIRDDDF